MTKVIEPIAVDFPLRGEWFAPNTPGKKVPSHGTDIFGQRYAYDFVGTDPSSKGLKFHRRSHAAYVFVGVRLEDCYGWGQPIYSPVEGTVVQAHDGWPERRRVHFLRDLVAVFKNSLIFNLQRKRDYRCIAGNYLIIESQGVYALMAHARCGSLAVREGQKVTPGQLIAEVGHSGNSTAPHLHFQLMDKEDPLSAKGLPCCFREYEVFRDGTWHTVTNGVPTHTERIRRM